MSIFLKMTITAAANGWVIRARHAEFGTVTRVAQSEPDLLAEIAAALRPRQETPLHRGLRVDHPAQHPGVDLAGGGAVADVVAPQQDLPPAVPAGGDHGRGDGAGSLDAGGCDLGRLVGHQASSCGAGEETSIAHPGAAVDSGEAR